jgi:A/G-specific adenine glycosylase
VKASVAIAGFAAQLVGWQRLHGRHDLPWQGTRDPYRVWLSEIMLQQTQVATVKAYFARFLQRFPNVASLAGASEDDVLGLWSGLGYYSRARNLHRCAQAIVQQHGGEFPQDAATLAGLPGIGRSTAAAVAALCFSERVAILDANVRRVVTRVHGFSGDLAQAAQERVLWALATDLLPTPADAPADMAAYTQGMMDLGASLCSARKPQCPQCPVSGMCRAFADGNPEQFPVRTRKLKRSSQSLWLLQAQTRQGAVFLVRRPDSGIWAGLFCLPVFDDESSLRAALPAAVRRHLQAQPVFLHVLTHRDLHLHTFRVLLPDAALLALPGQWIGAQDWPGLGLPAPVRKLLLPG